MSKVIDPARENLPTAVAKGLGMTPISSVAKSHSLAVTGPIVTLLPDSPATYPEWKRLVIKHSVQGTKVHDTRLVAAMNAHGVGRILTFNADDFRRYGIEILDPSVIGA